MLWNSNLQLSCPLQSRCSVIMTKKSSYMARALCTDSDTFAKRVAPTEIRVLRGRSKHHHTRHPVALTNRQTKISQDGECRHVQKLQEGSGDCNMSERRYHERSSMTMTSTTGASPQLEAYTTAGCRAQSKGSRTRKDGKGCRTCGRKMSWTKGQLVEPTTSERQLLRPWA